MENGGLPNFGSMACAMRSAMSKYCCIGWVGAYGSVVFKRTSYSPLEKIETYFVNVNILYSQFTQLIITTYYHNLHQALVFIYLFIYLFFGI